MFRRALLLQHAFHVAAWRAISDKRKIKVLLNECAYVLQTYMCMHIKQRDIQRDHSVICLCQVSARADLAGAEYRALRQGRAEAEAVRLLIAAF